MTPFAVSRRAALAGAGCVLAAALVLTLVLLRGDTPAGAAPSQSQNFFRTKLLEDRRTSKTIRDLLDTGGGMVDRSIAFRDLTGDDKTDAVVRVNSNTALGAVAMYVFSTHGAREGSELRAIYRQQALTRAFTRVSKNVLSFRTATYAPGDELCCPSKQVETTLKWDDEDDRLVVDSRREITATPTPSPTATADPSPDPTRTPSAR